MSTSHAFDPVRELQAPHSPDSNIRSPLGSGHSWHRLDNGTMMPPGTYMFRILHVAILMLSLMVFTLGFTWPLFWTSWIAGVLGIVGAILNLQMYSGLEAGGTPVRRGAAGWLSATAFVAVVCFWTALLVAVGLFVMADVCESPIEYSKQYQKNEKYCKEYDTNIMRKSAIHFCIESGLLFLLGSLAALGVFRTLKILRHCDLEQLFSESAMKPMDCPYAQAVVIEDLRPINEGNMPSTKEIASMSTSRMGAPLSPLIATSSTGPESSKAREEAEVTRREEERLARKDKERLENY